MANIESKKAEKGSLLAVLIFSPKKPKYKAGQKHIYGEGGKMIKPTNHNGVQIGDIQKMPVDMAQSLGRGILDHKKEILNIYEEHLKVTAPTYSDEIKKAMKTENINESHLNASIIKTMNKTGVSVTKGALSTIVNQLQEDHLFKLFEAGYDIEKLTIDIIAKEIRQSDNAPRVADQKEADRDQDITQALAEAGLPATSKNIETLEQYKDKVEDIIEESDITATNMMRHQSETTVNNLYTAKHRGTPKDSEKPPTEEEIIAVLNMNGIKVTQENMKAVRNLIGGNIEITKENVKSYMQIQGTINKMDSQELIKRAAKDMKKGDNPGDVNISHGLATETGKYEYDEIKQMVDDIQHIDRGIIEDNMTKERPLTIGNLQQTLHENVEKVLKGNHEEVNIEDGSMVEDPERPEKVDTSRRQLEEIRLSLTLEAALKLNSKLDIKTTELTKVVEELRAIEKQNNEDVLRNMGLAVTEENLDQIQQTKERIYNIAGNKEIAMAKVVEGEADFNLKGMDEAIKLRQVQDSYEETGSKPERRFGEGIAKVEEQIGHILEMNEIEVSTTNIKAAKALVENDIDVTPEAVETAKSVLLKIETVLYELRPAVVAQLIQEGIRPDTMPVDDLIDHIRQIQQEASIDPKQKLAEAILELDKTNTLNPKEREGLVAVYRMLNTITKNETAAIGFLLDNKREPTLGNLFEASKYIKQIGSKTGKMDVTIDDDLGIRQEKGPANIRSLIEEATKLPATSKNIIDQWLSRITPEELKKYMDIDKSLEELELKDGKVSPHEAARTTKQVEALEKISPHTVRFLEEKEIPLTIPNLYWTDKMIKNPYLLGDMLKEYETLTGEKIDTSIENSDKEKIEDILEGLEKELDEQSVEWLSAGQSAQAYNTGKELEQMLRVQKQISQNEGIYQIPVQLHHGMSNLNVYVMKDKEGSSKVERDELKAYMSIKTKNLGVIQVNMRISDQAVAFEMIGERPEVTLALQKGAKELNASIEEIGYKVMQAKFSQGKTGTSLLEEPKESETLLKYRFEESKFEHII